MTDDTPSLHVIGRLEMPAFDPADFPGFSIEQIERGLTVLAALPTEAEIAVAARICPVFRSITGAG